MSGGELLFQHGQYLHNMLCRNYTLRLEAPNAQLKILLALLARHCERPKEDPTASRSGILYIGKAKGP